MAHGGTFRQNAWILAVLAVLPLLLPLSPSAAAEGDGGKPRLLNSSIRFGLSPAITADSMAQFSFTVANPGPAPAPVEVRLEPEGGGTLFTRNLTIPPRSEWEDSAPILTSPVESYQVSLLLNGETVARDKALIRLESSNRHTVVVINDDPDYAGLSESLRDPQLFQKAASSGIRASQTPDSWERFGDSVAVALVKPDPRQFSQRQLQALDDYVRHGGTLLWIHPEGALAAAGTPLAALLPVHPLRLRACEDFNFLRAWAGLPAGTATRLQPAGGRPFLEALPGDAGGVTPLSTPDGLPVLHWQRHGLGTIGWCAFDLTDPVFRDTGAATALWNHIWAATTLAPTGAARGGDAPLGELLSLLCGYRVPGLALVRNFLALYVGLTALLLVVGYACRRPMWAWFLAAGLGIAFSVAVIRTAQQQAAQQMERSCTTVTLAAWGGPRQTAESAISLFSKSDDRPALDAPGQNGFFYPLVARTFGGLARREALTTPLRLNRQNGEQRVEPLTVQSLKPRRLAMTWTGTAAGAPPPATVTLDRTGAHLVSWPLPAALSDATAAWLVLPGGALPLRADQGRITGPVDRLVTFDPAAAAATALLCQAVLPTPTLAIATPQAGQAPAGLRVGAGDYAPFEYRFTLLPVQTAFAGDTVVFPPEWIRIEPGDTRSRLLWRDNRWQPATLRGDLESYNFNVVLPTAAAGWQLHELTVTLDADNPGGNILFEVAITAPTTIADSTRSSRATDGGLAPVRQAGNNFFFAAPAAHSGVFQPHSGRLGLKITLRQKRALANQLDSERVNRWAVNRLTATPAFVRPPPDDKPSAGPADGGLPRRLTPAADGAPSAGRDIARQLVDEQILLGEHGLHHVADGHHADHPPLRQHRQMPYPFLGHQRHAVLDGLILGDIDDRPRHDVPHRRLLGRLPLEDDLPGIIALGNDAAEFVALHHQ